MEWALLGEWHKLDLGETWSADVGLTNPAADGNMGMGRWGKSAGFCRFA